MKLKVKVKKKLNKSWNKNDRRNSGGRLRQKFNYIDLEKRIILNEHCPLSPDPLPPLPQTGKVVLFSAAKNDILARTTESSLNWLW